MFGRSNRASRPTTSPYRRAHTLVFEHLEDRLVLAAIDLVAVLVDGPSRVAPGSTVPVFSNVANRGTSPSGPFSVAYYLSSDSSITTSDTLLRTVSRPSLGGGGSSQTLTESVSLPATIRPGTYDLGLIVDPTNAIAETNEANNATVDSTPITVTTSTPINIAATLNRNPVNVDTPAPQDTSGNASLAKSVTTPGARRPVSVLMEYDDPM
jgi:subtilase family serine protease